MKTAMRESTGVQETPGLDVELPTVLIRAAGVVPLQAEHYHNRFSDEIIEKVFH